MKRDGFLDTFEQLGGTVLSNSCGPCIGQWKRADGVKGKADSIVSSFNRNFPGRNDGISETLSFLASPEVVTAYAISGDLGLRSGQSERSRARTARNSSFEPPVGEELPAKGFAKGEEGFVAPAENGDQLDRGHSADQRTPTVVAAVPAVGWQGFREAAALDQDQRQNDNRPYFTGRSLAEVPRPLGQDQRQYVPGCQQRVLVRAGKGTNVLTGESDLTIAQIARAYKAKGIGSIVVGDENYGEGSSREHAAMSPRFLNVRAVITKSFARIHETNLKKQGILPLTFADPKDYDKIEMNDRLSVVDLANLAPGKPVHGHRSQGERRREGSSQSQHDGTANHLVQGRFGVERAELNQRLRRGTNHGKSRQDHLYEDR